MSDAVRHFSFAALEAQVEAIRQAPRDFGRVDMIVRWPLAGDQLYVDFDLSAANAPPGTRLAVGTAIVEVSAEPHTGCKVRKL